MTTSIKPGTPVMVTVKPISPKGKPSIETGIFQRYERTVKDSLGRDVITYVVAQERESRNKPIEVKFYSNNIVDIRQNRE